MQKDLLETVRETGLQTMEKLQLRAARVQASSDSQGWSRPMLGPGLPEGARSLRKLVLSVLYQILS